MFFPIVSKFFVSSPPPSGGENLEPALQTRLDKHIEITVEHRLYDGLDPISADPAAIERLIAAGRIDPTRFEVRVVGNVWLGGRTLAGRSFPAGAGEEGVQS